jgi:hypothetical protein
MAIIDRLDKLGEYLIGFTLFQLPSFLQVLFELTSAGILHDYGDRLHVLQRKGHLQLNNILVAELLQRLCFFINFRDPVSFELPAFNELHRNLLPCHLIQGQVHLPKAALYSTEALIMGSSRTYLAKKSDLMEGTEASTAVEGLS